ncbi:MAG: macro domain-containing protein [Lachnospiraceae bacterium]|nr:macro domain-containing protein [Lachnospiraceae bacterium]
MSFKIVRNDITKMQTEAIVNTANEFVCVGAGCDAAVYQAAGYEKLLAYRREHIGNVPAGEAFITPGFDLAAKYIIHTVSPFYVNGGKREEEKLRACYSNSLRLAKEHGIKEISFPLISTGSFGYPKEEGMRIAIDEITAFLLSEDMSIVLVVFDSQTTKMGAHLYPDLETYINQNYVYAKEEEEYGTNSFDTFAKKDVLRPQMPIARSSSVRNTAIDFKEEHESRLEERMKHISDTFSQYLMFLIQSKGLDNTTVYKRAIVDKKVFSKIKNNKEYHPQKITALCLCIGVMLNLDEAKDLLARAGYALSPCDKTDIIFTYFIENKIYDMIELDIQLEEHGLPCIIS